MKMQISKKIKEVIKMKVKKSILLGLFLILGSLFVLGGDVVVKEGKLNVTNDVIIGTDKFFVNGTNGNIGVNTISPRYPIEVYQVASYDTPAIFINMTGGGNRQIKYQSSNAHTWSFGGDDSYIIYRDGAQIFYINWQKYIKVGNGQPKSEFDVNGTITSNNINITNNATINTLDVKKIGINTSNPKHLLDAYASASYTYPIIFLNMTGEGNKLIGHQSSNAVDWLYGGNDDYSISRAGTQAFKINWQRFVKIGSGEPNEVLDVAGTIKTNLTGTGNAYACLDNNGRFYRSATACA